MPTRRQRSSVAAEDENESKKARSGLAVGDMIPDMELETDESTNDNKKTINLKNVADETGLVIFFYPKAATPGCTKQACGFRDYYKDLLNKGYQVFGMSGDKPKQQANWKNKQDLPYTLLCDTSFEFMKAIGIMKGAKSIKRSHIIVDKGGKISAIEISVSPQKSVDLAVEKIIGDVEDEEEENEPEQMQEDDNEQQQQKQEEVQGNGVEAEVAEEPVAEQIAEEQKDAGTTEQNQVNKTAEEQEVVDKKDEDKDMDMDTTETADQKVEQNENQEKPTADENVAQNAVAIEQSKPSSEPAEQEKTKESTDDQTKKEQESVGEKKGEEVQATVQS
eukprot:TRINITY_DN51229_c0_g1_i1.p1 TRINITY_DN51229_c0_g1~~TRINITY_DN51229_c0_g1_i1.p1  ORF type:complete len:334 (-),score=100.65 TRINITY_DN51229_c0_g1_i1:185-1186(-)